MKKYQYEAVVHILWVVLSSAGTACLFFAGWYWPAVICLAITFQFVHRLYKFQTRTMKDMKRLIEAVQFSEFNISFKNFAGKGLAPELIPDMETAVAAFNQKSRKMEIEQHFYNMLLNRIDFGLLVVDKQKKITYINKAALDVFDRPQPHRLSDLKTASADLPEILEKLLPHETKVVGIKRGKNDYRLVVTAMYFISEGRELKLISLKNIQSVLDESESDAWKKLIRVLTHEIMNSLSPIISLSETFSVPVDENRELLMRAMQTIHRRSKGLVEFVNNYKKLTHIPQPVISKFSAKDWIEDIYHLLQAENYSFDYTVLPKDMTIEADRALLEQVLINLIKNACVSGRPENPAKVKVIVSKNEYQRPLIKVSDTGEGILPEVMDKIFVPFFTTKTNGSGIGLSICRQIANLHGGKISVQSEPEKGSCFTLQL
ncbi:sensor histidine kinase [Bacteroidia bacterium]|nr:sensor histidine kinase [Bacteroidia bacterium]